MTSSTTQARPETEGVAPGTPPSVETARLDELEDFLESLRIRLERVEAVKAEIVADLIRRVDRVENEANVVAAKVGNEVELLRTRRLEVVDEAGRVRCVLGAGLETFSGLQLLDQHGTRVAWLNVYDLADIEKDEAPDEPVEGQAGLFLSSGGNVVAGIAVGDECASLYLADGEGATRVAWDVGADGTVTQKVG